MKRLRPRSRTIALLGVLVPLVALVVYVAVRSGPLAPVEVTVAEVETRAIAPAVFGVGIVEARQTFKIGPTAAGRLKRLEVNVGDTVKAGQVIAEMDPVDLHERVRALDATVRRSEAAQAEAHARREYAAEQVHRYERLVAVQFVSGEVASGKQRELQIAEAGFSAAAQESARARSEREALYAQLRNLVLVSPVTGLVSSRDAEPGTTVLGGQKVVEVVEPRNTWVNARFDQLHAAGLAPGLPARVTLRSLKPEVMPGRVVRVEPVADAVTEEARVKIVLEPSSGHTGVIGELAEVTVDLAPASPALVVPNAAIHRHAGALGVWQMVGDGVQFTRVELGGRDLDGLVQVRRGLKAGDRIVVYSQKALSAATRPKVVAQIDVPHAP
jgi:HlyD family secretion protein